MAHPLPVATPWAVILAGGLGTRLRPVLPHTAKTLASIQGRPFIDLVLHHLQREGIRRAILCTGHLGDQVREQLGENRCGLALDYSPEPSPLGTAGALRLAYSRFGAPVPWLVVNGDTFLEFHLAALLESHRSSGCQATLAAVEVPDARRFGALDLAPDGRILAFREKSAEPGPRWINGGVYLLENAFLASLPVAVPSGLESDVFPNWISRGLNAYRCPGRFLDIGTPESYAFAATFFQQL